uniref:sensor domain-containing phosphodiesterase n=1 Tax=Ningiella ruwaisensis TaxID=2364274 RepID=UPI0010A04B70|nr:diguanylate cyclase [Ningiella ruwaisensis]
MQKREVVSHLSENELRSIVPELQHLTERYKRAEKIQKALYLISELSSSAVNLDSLYESIHNVVRDFMTADNFYVAFHEQHDERINFAYFVDERDEQAILSIPYEKIKKGITAHILRSGKKLVITQENYEEVYAKHGIEMLGTPPVDLIGVPLMRNNQVIGTMVVQSYNENVRYSDDDLEILTFISQHIVTTVDRVKHRELTEELIKQRTQQLQIANKELEDEIAERKRVEALQKALFEISELSASYDLDILRFYGAIHQILKRLIEAENFYIAILDDEKQLLTFPYFVGKSEDASSSRKMGKGLTEYVIRKAKACLIDAAKISSLIEGGELREQIGKNMLIEGNSWMGAPLVLDNAVFGVIAVQTYGASEDYSEEDLNILRYVSQHIAVAMERRENAQALKNYNKQLSDKVKERTAELNQTNESLKRQIEQRKEIELKLIHDAHHDALTGLPNRVMFNNRLELAISSKRRHGQHNYALLFVDLDRFKTINDTLGHHAGDEFLIEVAARLKQCKRSHDLLARLGGDEFVILVDSYNHLSDVEAIAQRIVDIVSRPFTIEKKEVYSGASVGVAELSETYTTADDALRDADAAMYQAKNLGKNRFIVFDVSMRNQLIEEVELERDFRKAFKQNAFNCYLQAVVDLHNGDVLYYEHTLRWESDTHGEIKDAAFWRLADQCGLTFSINQYLIDQSFKVLKQWGLSDSTYDQRISMKLSVEHLLHKKSMDSLIQLLEWAEVDPSRLLIELSEQSLARFSKYLPNILDTLTNMGVALVLNNFGSETAALSYLFKYDFDLVKLNANLVNTIGMSDKYHKLVQSFISIANHIDIEVIGDGVIDAAVKQELMITGCRYGQGDYLAEVQAL